MEKSQELVHSLRVKRFRIMRHETFSPEINCQFLDAGIDPDNLWVLVNSFDNEHSAKTRLAVEQTRNRIPEWTYRMVDGGQEEVVDRW